MNASVPTEAPGERYRRLASALTDRVEAVPADRWDSQSPCPEWTARDVLKHVIDGETQFVGRVDLKIPAGPSVDDDPAGAWRNTRDTVQSFLDDPKTANLEYESQMGKGNIGDAFNTYMSVDLVVHGWDIANAAGIDDTIPAADVALVHDFVKDKGDMLRSPGGFGPELQASSDADAQTRLLAFLGRQSVQVDPKG